MLLKLSIDNKVMRLTRQHVDSVQMRPELFRLQVALLRQVDDCQLNVAGLTHQWRCDYQLSYLCHAALSLPSSQKKNARSTTAS